MNQNELDIKVEKMEGMTKEILALARKQATVSDIETIAENIALRFQSIHVGECEARRQLPGMLKDIAELRGEKNRENTNIETTTNEIVQSTFKSKKMQGWIKLIIYAALLIASAVGGSEWLTPFLRN